MGLKPQTLWHLKQDITTIGNGEPLSKEGSEGNFSLRKVAEGLGLFVKHGNIWHDVNNLKPAAFEVIAGNAVARRRNIHIDGGKVGIGTALPAKALHVANSALIKGRATFPLSGTINVTGTNTNVPGVNTRFTTELSIGDDIVVTGETRTVTAITDDTTATVNVAWGSDLANDLTPDCNPAAFTVIRDTGDIGMILDDDGNVGIGITDPTDELEIVAAAGAGMTLTSSHSSIVNGDVLGTISFRGYDEVALAGFPAIGAKIVAEASEAWGSTDDPDDAPTELQFWTCDNDAANAIAQRMVIQEAGNVGIGTTAPGFKLAIEQSRDGEPLLYIEPTHATNPEGIQVIYSAGGLTAGAGGQFLRCGDSSADRMRCVGNGDVYTATGTDIQQITSDRRMKTNIKDYTGGLDIVNALSPRTYEWKDGKGETGTQYGFVSQEIQAISDIKEKMRLYSINDMKEDDKDRDLCTDGKMHTTQLSAKECILISAMQELSAKMDSMQLEIDSLKG